jgi:hypothetical protein
MGVSLRRYASSATTSSSELTGEVTYEIARYHGRSIARFRCWAGVADARRGGRPRTARSGSVRSNMIAIATKANGAMTTTAVIHAQARNGAQVRLFQASFSTVS